MKRRFLLTQSCFYFSLRCLRLSYVLLLTVNRFIAIEKVFKLVLSRLNQFKKKIRKIYIFLSLIGIRNPEVEESQKNGSYCALISLFYIQPFATEVAAILK